MPNINRSAENIGDKAAKGELEQLLDPERFLFKLRATIGFIVSHHGAICVPENNSMKESLRWLFLSGLIIPKVAPTPSGSSGKFFNHYLFNYTSTDEAVAVEAPALHRVCAELIAELESVKTERAEYLCRKATAILANDKH